MGFEQPNEKVEQTGPEMITDFDKEIKEKEAQISPTKQLESWLSVEMANESVEERVRNFGEYLIALGADPEKVKQHFADQGLEGVVANINRFRNMPEDADEIKKYIDGLK
jgi:hypothetical protein